ncbi:BZ3500_MvSof-1268-A1-R1_Chr12-2g03897 [Microbotryum saponariae]|uniref:Transcription initiation factor IIE subunit beta n=1 Tax=Microbotryum saponariae TaxID=289078 RepID=A0A2X0L2X6_9BASI|nr:BZ3500_MvSof-1268-A1-R1_Chr12-2g03897 [Microbotryum saponariae]SCZ99789.1 BZ3501_MvSof-1269-A2-R1_Chr12-2g03491 [Microbotryum saponariae]
MPTPSNAPAKLPARQAPRQVGPADTGIGRHWKTQLVSAVHFLKQHAHPIRLEDLALLSGVEALLSNAELLSNFRSHEKVVVDDKTGLFSYKPDYDIKSKFDLENLVVRYSSRGGLSVKNLRASWPNVVPAIEELEQEGKVYVTRTGGSAEREGAMKAVFRNEFSKRPRIDDEFLKLWKKLKAPTKEELSVQLNEGRGTPNRSTFIVNSSTDAASYLRSIAGLTTASTVASDLPRNQNKNPRGKGRKGPGSANRRIKLTNTHLKGKVDLSKDYTPPGR